MPKTIKSYLSSVHSLPVDASLPFKCCESLTVQCLIRGIKHFYGEKARTPKLPITLAILCRLISVSGDLSLRDNANFSAAVKLAWAGFLQCGEFTVANGQSFNPTIHLTRSLVKFIPNIDEPMHICLTLPSSKTDLFKKRVLILIAEAPGSGESRSTCTVLALQYLFCHYL
jgi:hypothetical protein